MIRLSRIYGAAVFALAALACSPIAAASDGDAAPWRVQQDDIIGAGHVRALYSFEHIRLDGDAMAAHNFGAAFGLTDNITISAASYATSTGVGSIFVNATLDGGEIFGLTFRPALGVTIPNGYDEKMLPFDQISTGTFDLQPAVALYDDRCFGPIGCGVQYVGNISIGTNPHEFAFGDTHKFIGWLSADVTENFEPYIGAEANLIGTPSFGGGFDEFEVLFGSAEIVSVGGGANFFVGPLRLSGEVTFPISSSGAVEVGTGFTLGVSGTF